MGHNDNTERTGRPKVYMETTMFNYYFDEERGEAHEYTVRLFEMVKKGFFKAYTSYYVTSELEKAHEEKRIKMLELIDKYNMIVLNENGETNRIGNLYVERKVIPKKYLTDALHIAIATVYKLDIISSMNFEHIVKPKTIRMTGDINIENGYDIIRICSPEEVVRYGIEDRAGSK